MIGEASRKWWLLGAMGGILGIILLDETVVGVALPTIQTELGLSEVESHWVVNVYMLSLAGFAAVAGWATWSGTAASWSSAWPRSPAASPAAAPG